METSKWVEVIVLAGIFLISLVTIIGWYYLYRIHSLRSQKVGKWFLAVVAGMSAVISASVLVICLEWLLKEGLIP